MTVELEALEIHDDEILVAARSGSIRMIAAVDLDDLDDVDALEDSLSPVPESIAEYVPRLQGHKHVGR